MFTYFIPFVFFFITCQPPVEQTTPATAETVSNKNKDKKQANVQKSDSKTSNTKDKSQAKSADTFSDLLQDAEGQGETQSQNNSQGENQNSLTSDGSGGSGSTIITTAARFAGRSYRTSRLNLIGQNLPKDQSDGFHCPGNSFLVGIEGTFDLDAYDREFRVKCQFFETQDGQDLKKTSCHMMGQPYNTAGEFSSSFSCPKGEHLAGLKSTYDEKTKDRLITFECCSMGQIVTWAGEANSPEHISCNKRVTQEEAYKSQENYNQFGPLINDDVNMIQQPFAFTCPDNTILSTIRSSFMDGKYDRRYSFRCCPLQKGEKS